MCKLDGEYDDREDVSGTMRGCVSRARRSLSFLPSSRVRATTIVLCVDEDEVEVVSAEEGEKEEEEADKMSDVDLNNTLLPVTTRYLCRVVRNDCGRKEP